MPAYFLWKFLKVFLIFSLIFQVLLNYSSISFFKIGSPKFPRKYFKILQKFENISSSLLPLKNADHFPLSPPNENRSFMVLSKNTGIVFFFWKHSVMKKNISA